MRGLGTVSNWTFYQLAWSTPQTLPGLQQYLLARHTSFIGASKLLILLQGLQHGDLFDYDSLFLLELLILCAVKHATLY